MGCWAEWVARLFPLRRLLEKKWIALRGPIIHRRHKSAGPARL